MLAGTTKKESRTERRSSGTSWCIVHTTTTSGIESCLSQLESNGKTTRRAVAVPRRLISGGTQ
jgi:hypothetical protein